MGDISLNFNFRELFVSRDFPELAEQAYSEHKEDILLHDKIVHLSHLCLQPLRDYVDSPAKIDSGFRSEALNLAVGGEPDSDHKRGLAGDITFPSRIADLLQIYKWGVKNLCYRQIIYYPDKKFIHVSINWPGLEYKHKALVALGSKYVPLEEYING